MDGVGLVVPVMFANALVHKDVANSMLELCKKYWPKATKYRFESAGDFSAGFDCQVGGRSETLNLESSFIDKVHIQYNDSLGIISL